MTNTHLEELLAGQPPDVQAEILHINTDARPIALQIALLVPLIAALLGLLQRLPDDAAPRPRAVGGRRELARPAERRPLGNHRDLANAA